MFEIQEALAEAKAGGLDETTRRTLTEQRERLLARHAEEEARLDRPAVGGVGWGGPGQAAGPPGRVQASAGHPRLPAHRDR